MRLIALRPHTYNGVDYTDGDTYEADEAYPDVINTLLVMHFATRAPEADPAAGAVTAAPPTGESTAPPTLRKRR